MPSADQTGRTGHDVLDCVVVGAGAAGLTAAVYLARFRRSLIVLDGGSSRLLIIPRSHNYPGFADGIHGADVLERLRGQAMHYEVPMETATVDHISRNEGGLFAVHAGERRWAARTVLLATGVIDVAPPFAEVARAVDDGCLRYCPICDGYEAIGKRVAVIGRGNGGMQEAIFMRHYAAQVQLYALGDPLHLTQDDLQELEAADVQVIASPVIGLELEEGPVPQMRLALADGSRPGFDVVYSALGTLVNGGLGQLLGARSSDDGALIVDAHQQTTVDGLYAAGDVVAGLNQIVVAMGQAAIATTAIHNRLRKRQARHAVQALAAPG